MSWAVWLNPRVLVWRGGFTGYVEVPPGRELPKPWCAVCQRPVDRVTDTRSGRVVRIIAYCHGRMDVVDAPLEQIQAADKLELGVAFGGKPPPSAREQERRDAYYRSFFSWNEAINANWREDIQRRKRDLGLEAAEPPGRRR